MSADYRDAFVAAVLDTEVSPEMAALDLRVRDIVTIARWLAPVAAEIISDAKAEVASAIADRTGHRSPDRARRCAVSAEILRQAASRIRHDVDFDQAHGDPEFLSAVADWLDFCADQQLASPQSFSTKAARAYLGESA